MPAHFGWFAGYTFYHGCRGLRETAGGSRVAHFVWPAGNAFWRGCEGLRGTAGLSRAAHFGWSAGSTFWRGCGGLRRNAGGLRAAHFGWSAGSTFWRGIAGGQQRHQQWAILGRLLRDTAGGAPSPRAPLLPLICKPPGLRTRLVTCGRRQPPIAPDQMFFCPPATTI